MSTTTSSQRNIKSRLPTSNSINNMATNGSETKPNRNGLKKPLSATNILQNYASSSTLNTRSKKSTAISNNFHQNKPTKPVTIDKTNNNNNNHHQHNGHYLNKKSLQSMSHSPSPPFVFHAIAPAPVSKEINEQK
ncbi:unnamed protein product, partial [Rotaria sp. Silwood2]